MLLVISPAKTLDFETPSVTQQHSQPEFIGESKQLISTLRKLAPHEISELMKISEKLGSLNFDRFQQWRPSFKFGDQDTKQAILAFRGDVYTGLEADRFNEADFGYAQHHLRILSGLYGVLRPMDLMRPYRLEMGTGLATARGKNLYQFWGDALTERLNQDLKAANSEILLNLASQEYFKVIHPNRLQGRLVSPVFKDLQKGQYKIVSFFAKKARGMMAAHVIQNQIKDLSSLRRFKGGGYRYNAELSTPDEPVFTRDKAS